MTGEFRLPDLGEGLADAEIVQWLVAEGDTVALNQTLAEVETAKAVVELPSPMAGVVGRLHAAAGDTVAVGAPLVTFGTPTPAATPETSRDAAADALPNLVGYGAGQADAARPARRRRTVPSAPVTSGASPSDDAGERPRSTPPVRKLAKDLGVDLAALAAQTPGRPVTRADVEASAGPPSAAPLGLDTEDRAREVRIPIRGVRKHTAAAMVRSAFTAPHATTFLTVDVTASMALLGSLKGDRALDGHRIGVLALAAKAVCLALARTPALGSRWDEEAGVIVEPRYVNLGIAAATARGLVVPNVPDADRLGLVDLADALGTLADDARAGRSTPASLQGGTFTITNVGVFGVDAGTPILNPGEAGILALGAVVRRPWEHEGAIALREVTTLSLSFDHRIVDGAEAARFLTDVAGMLRDPGRAMLF